MRKSLDGALLLLFMLLMLPAFANAATYWAITASTSPAALKPNLTPARPMNFGNYTTPGGLGATNVTNAATTSVDYNVSIPAGYSLVSVKVDGVVAGTTAGTYTVNKGTVLSHTIVASYAATSYTITTQVASGGTISASGSYSTSLPITVTPSVGNQLTGVVIDAVTYALTDVLPSFVTRTGSSAGSTYTFTSGSHTVKGVFALLATASARITTPSQTVPTGTTGILLDGSASTSTVPGTSFVWSATCGTVSATVPNGTTATYNAATVATTCSVTLTVNAPGITPSPSASINITTQVPVLVETQICLNCHDGNNGPAVPGFTTTLHYSRLSCQDCHNPVQAMSHPYAAFSTMANVCASCHADSQGNVPLHPIAIGTNPCLSCHDPHSLVSLVGAPAGHYNNVTSAGYPASYMSVRETCRNCHIATATNAVVRHQWASSGHAATTEPPWASQDFKTKSGCVQCHTTTGFIAYSTGKMTAAWGVASDKTKEVLTCVGCHSNLSTGEVRNVSPVRPFADDSFQNHDLSKSNLCMDCHSGRNNGKSIAVKVGVADFTNTPFVAPHYLSAAGTLQGASGYHFPGQVYASYSSNNHREVGIGNSANTGTSGPCATCHMSAVDKHTFKTVTTDLSGTVTAITASVCVNCHSGALDATQLNADKVMYLNSLVVLKAMLASKGFVYSASYPYFTNTNWGVGQAGANVMGAAFNYVLLLSEPGAYTHNPLYAKQLVLSSIDYLDNGQFDDSVTTLAIPSLLASGAISQTVADSFVAYKAKQNLCTSCHGFTASSGAPMASFAHPAHLTGAYGPGAYFGPDVSACQACHVSNSTSHRNGAVDLVAGGCLGCHAGAAPAWNSATRLDCTSCHAATPAVLPNGVAAPYKANFALSGHGQYPASNQCTVCHDPNSRHISGSLGSYTRLRLLNDNNLCASCHNTATVGIAFRNMSTHVTPDGRALGCRDCHDPHGSSNLSMIRSQINGVTIVFTDKINAFIDPVTNRGLCQVCHTLTAHYRAGVAETGHFTSGCLNCHSHNSAGGAFRPVGGGACDSCHGYPPAPRNLAASFGTPGNWVAARFEDYSGGGGAHLAAGHISPNADPSQGWANCAVCHNAGIIGSTPYHSMATPVKSHIDKVTVKVDPKLRFSEGFTVYTGAKLANLPAANATGSCFNISCHMSQSPRWSTER
jgi:trimeric autotransporter adhesin